MIIMTNLDDLRKREKELIDNYEGWIEGIEHEPKDIRFDDEIHSKTDCIINFGLSLDNDGRISIDVSNELFNVDIKNEQLSEDQLINLYETIKVYFKEKVERLNKIKEISGEQ